jgi:hypothetical protein
VGRFWRADPGRFWRASKLQTAKLRLSRTRRHGTFTIVLNTQPAADVTISLSSNNTAEGTVAPTSVIFTTADWSSPQAVTVAGVDDAVRLTGAARSREMSEVARRR